MNLVKRTLWSHTRSPYRIYEMLLENPRIPKTHIARRLKVNPKTVDAWVAEAVAKRIIIPPVLRRKSFLNFRERFYFVHTKDPHSLYEELKEDENVLYYSVQTGFANFQIIAKSPIDVPGYVVLEGDRSDYFATIPPECTFQDAVSQIKEKLENLDSLKSLESPLQYHNEEFDPWDKEDERIFWSVCNDLRKPVRQIMRELSTYSDKVIQWLRSRDRFGHAITMYFPEGESAYLYSIFYIETQYDSLIIDIFSSLPVTNVFYRLDGKLIMCIYLPFIPSPGGRYLVRKILHILKKRKFVEDYTNSIVEYYFRP
jgi:hypothetical protein